MQGNSKGLRVLSRHTGQDEGFRESHKELAVDRGQLHDGGDTRSSLQPSMVALGCLDGGDKRGGGQGYYLR
jgi:hypothetical protein